MAPCAKSQYHHRDVLARWVSGGQGTLDDIVELATKKAPLLAESTLGRNGHFQLELVNADAALRAARALLYESAEAERRVAIDQGSEHLASRLPTDRWKQAYQRSEHSRTTNGGTIYPCRLLRIGSG